MNEREIRETDIEEAFAKVEEALAENESLEILTEEELGIIKTYRSVDTAGKFGIIHYCVETLCGADKLDAFE